VPQGLVAVFWLRQFKPVPQAGLPQMPSNSGLDGLGFVKDAYRRITHLLCLDFRVAARLSDKTHCLFIKTSLMQFRTSRRCRRDVPPFPTDRGSAG